MDSKGLIQMMNYNWNLMIIKMNNKNDKFKKIKYAS